MKLSEKAISDFQKTYYQVTQKEIDSSTAREYAKEFMKLFAIAIKNRHKKVYNKNAS